MKIGDKVFIPATVESVKLGARVRIDVGPDGTFWLVLPENLLLTELPPAPQSDIICDPDDPRVAALIGERVEVCDELRGKEGWKTRKLDGVEKSFPFPFMVYCTGWRYIRPIRKPALKPITPKELAAMGYELKEADGE